MIYIYKYTYTYLFAFQLYTLLVHIFNMLPPKIPSPSAHLPLLQQQVGNLLHARVLLQAMRFGAVRNGHGPATPGGRRWIQPRGPPPNQGCFRGPFC